MKKQRKDGKWAARVYDANAKNRQRWLGTFKTEAEADEAIRKAMLGTSRSTRARTVADWVDIWLRDYQRPAFATRQTYAYAARQIRQDIGTMDLGHLDRPTARRLARGWPRGTTRVARTIFSDAHRDGVIGENPFSNMRLETSKGRKDLDALTEPEIFSLADSALPALGEYGQEFRAVLVFLGFVGCRPGELCCIRRDDLDVERGEVTIRFALDGQGGEKAPKNGKPRVVVVPPPALEALRTVPVRPGSKYLFHTATGKRLSKATLSYYFRVVRQRWAERPAMHLYELRHAAATLLMERGLAPHIVASQLGHTDGGALVQRLYGHPAERGMRDQVKLAFANWPAHVVEFAEQQRRMRGAS